MAYNPCWLPIFEKHKNIIENNLKIYESSSIPVYPLKDKIFKVFEMDIMDINVVLLGQDCYHGPNQANGLAFSVNEGVAIPPSLKNIFKEIQNNYPEKNYTFKHGNLERWFNEEKIFLLNSSLTVLQGKPAIFMKEWINFTDDIIKFIAENNKDCIFLLLGNFAKEKNKFIKDITRYIEGIHPSPLSAHRGFFGSNIFKKLDEKLIEKSKKSINWNV